MSLSSWSHPAFEPLGDLVRRRAGLAFLVDRAPELEAGVRRAMEHARVRDPAEYLRQLQASDRAVDALLDEITVGETYFFREPEHFRLIRQAVVPPLLGPEAALRPVRVWSAGCATGEEAWTLAIVLAQEGLAERTRVLATDVSRRALAAAERGVYCPWSLRACDDTARLAYFGARGADFEIRERYRPLVDFRYLNLAVDAFPSLANGTWGLDLILCRNVLIYFDRETTKRVLGQFYEALVEGGWLFLGSSDPMATSFAPFEPVVTDAGVFYRRPAAGGAARRTRLPSGPLSTLPSEGPVAAPAPALPERRGGARASSPGPAPVPLDPTATAVDAAQAALGEGDYVGCLRLLEAHVGDSRAARLRVRAVAALSGPVAALVHAAETVRRFPLDTEAHYLHAALLAEAGRDAEAEDALRRVLYLDRSLAVAHVVLATLLARRADLPGARRAWENVRSLCAALPPEAVLPLADGERAGALAEVASGHLAMLDRREAAA
jgi:chemotaxis protein methyltransferase CheR